MSDMFVSSRENQRQLEDLKQEQEQKLQKLRSEFKRREKLEQEAGEAAINHIKKNNQERLDQARANLDRKAAQEIESLSKNYSDLKRRASVQNDQLENQLRLNEERYDQKVEALQANEQEAIRQSQTRIRDFLETQRELREAARKTSNDEVEKIRSRETKQIVDAKEHAANRLRDVETDSRLRLEQLKNQKETLYTGTKAQWSERINDIQHQGNLKLESERAEKNRALNQMQTRYKEAFTTEQKRGSHRLEEVNKNNQQAERTLRERALQKNEQLRAEFSMEANRLDSQGNADLTERQEKFRQLKNEQQLDHRQQLTDLKESLLAEEAETRKRSMDRAKFETQKLDQTLAEKRKEFKERFNVADKTNQEALRNQKESYLKELYKLQKSFDAKFGTQQGRSDDPFYQVKSFDAQIIENPDSYELKARVPKHERETVDVIVKEDKIVLSAKRSHEKDFVDDNGVRTTTNSFQTYRQDIKVDAPLDRRKVFKKIDEDGNISVIVSKKGKPSKA